MTMFKQPGHKATAPEDKIDTFCVQLEQMIAKFRAKRLLPVARPGQPHLQLHWPGSAAAGRTSYDSQLPMV